MSSPEKKIRNKVSALLPGGNLTTRRAKLTHSAPWSFQKRNESLGFALFASFFGSVSLSGWKTFNSPTFFMDWACFFSISFFSFRTFISSTNDATWRESFKVLFKLALGWCLTLFVYFQLFANHLGQGPFSPNQWIFSAFTIPLSLWITSLGLQKTRPLLNSVRLRAVVVGVTPIGTELYNRSRSSIISDLNVVGFFDYRKEQRIPVPIGATFLDSPQALVQHIENEEIDLVIITLPMRQEERILELMTLLSDTTASVAFVPDIFQFDLMNSSLGELSGIPMITLRDTPFYGGKRFLKRTMDLVLGITILLVLSPVFLIIASLIKLSSPGPIYFRQKRVGLGTKPLDIWKFRSMYVQPAENYPMPAEKNDPRITRLGKWLRKYSLDELPQLLNVIQGEMSLVGPRPFPWEHSEKYRNVIQGYSLRHKIKPGMTGWAQVNGHRGLIETTEQLQSRVDYDLYYVKHWSLFFDCLILLRSIPKVFVGDEHAF
jgi:putative colanic acid biosynthesis UDP-glucose lipid carrier transferase